MATASVSDSGPAAGGTFTLLATVRNAGGEASAATTLRFYRSTVTTIATSDTEVGTEAVAGLAPLGTSSESVSLAAPSIAGTYYYGACVDAVTGESDTTNNCSPSVQVTVPEPGPESGPDLVVAAPTVSNNAPDAGAAFTRAAGNASSDHQAPPRRPLMGEACRQAQRHTAHRTRAGQSLHRNSRKADRTSSQNARRELKKVRTR